MGVPLQDISRGRDRDHDPWTDVRPELPTYVLGRRLGGRLTQIEQQLPALAERGPQQPWHRHQYMPVWHGLEHFLLEPLRPEQRALLLT